MLNLPSGPHYAAIQLNAPALAILQAYESGMCTKHVAVPFRGDYVGDAKRFAAHNRVLFVCFSQNFRVPSAKKDGPLVGELASEPAMKEGDPAMFSIVGGPGTRAAVNKVAEILQGISS